MAAEPGTLSDGSLPEPSQRLAAEQTLVQTSVQRSYSPGFLSLSEDSEDEDNESFKNPQQEPLTPLLQNSEAPEGSTGAAKKSSASDTSISSSSSSSSDSEDNDSSSVTDSTSDDQSSNDTKSSDSSDKENTLAISSTVRPVPLDNEDENNDQSYHSQQRQQQQKQSELQRSHSVGKKRPRSSCSQTPVPGNCGKGIKKPRDIYFASLADQGQDDNAVLSKAKSQDMKGQYKVNKEKYDIILDRSNKLDLEFVVASYWNQHETISNINLDIRRVLIAVAEKISKIDLKDVHLFMRENELGNPIKPDQTLNFGEVHDIYWGTLGPNYQNSEAWKLFVEENGLRGKPPSSVKSRTKELIGRLFSTKKFWPVAAAFITKLVECRYKHVRETERQVALGPLIKREADKLFNGDGKDVWSQILILPRVLSFPTNYPHARFEDQEDVSRNPIIRIYDGQLTRDVKDKEEQKQEKGSLSSDESEEDDEDFFSNGNTELENEWKRNRDVKQQLEETRLQIAYLEQVKRQSDMKLQRQKKYVAEAKAANEAMKMIKTKYGKKFPYYLVKKAIHHYMKHKLNESSRKTNPMIDEPHTTPR